MTIKSTDEIKNEIEEPTTAEADGERQQQEGRIDQAQHTIKNAVHKLFDRVRALRSEQGVITHTND